MPAGFKNEKLFVRENLLKEKNRGNVNVKYFARKNE